MSTHLPGKKTEFGGLGMIHLNGNLLCAIDVETTGTLPGTHDIIQICVLPLNSEIKPLKKDGVLPFYMTIKPRNPDNIDWQACGVNQLKMADIILNGTDSDVAADLLLEWYEKFKLGERKRISPLAQNWVFDHAFIVDWLGPKTFEYIFDGRYRDTMSSALFSNDRADFQGEDFPYPKVNLQYLATTLGVENQKMHDAMFDCMTTAEVYRRMVKRFP